MGSVNFDAPVTFMDFVDNGVARDCERMLRLGERRMSGLPYVLQFSEGNVCEFKLESLVLFSIARRVYCLDVPILLTHRVGVISDFDHLKMHLFFETLIL